MFTYLFLLLTLMLTGCSKDEPLPEVTDPQKAILGRWEVIANSDGPIRYPGYYREYRKDSILFNYLSEDDNSFSTYWFDGNLLFESHVYLDGVTGDTIIVDTQPYTYEFLSYNKLKLDLQQPATNTIIIYKRIK